MHSSSFINLISASALFALTQAAPVAQPAELNARGKIYSKCRLPSDLYWDGECSVDPCGQWISWCPDYQYGTKIPIGGNTNTPVTPPTTPQPPVTPPSSGNWYVCAASGFRNTCSYDPCDGHADSWCNDYEYKTYTKKAAAVSKRGLIYSKCKLPSGLAWDGYCSQDPCGMWQPWCVDYEFGTWTPKGSAPAPAPAPAPQPNPEPVPAPQPNPEPVPVPVPGPETCSAYELRFEPGVPNTCKYGSGLNFYTCQSNGFKGCCSSDPCAKDWCPDYKPKCYSA